MYAYFIDISQSSVGMHMRCGGIYNDIIYVKKTYQFTTVCKDDVMLSVL